MNPTAKKRQADFQIIARWVGDGERVLDLGCGRGVLLDFLRKKKQVYGIGVDNDRDKILSCVERGVPAYQGDIHEFLLKFPPHSFDRVILSRTVEQLEDANAILTESIRVGRHVTIGFVNHGYWKNRLNFLVFGRRTRNEVYPDSWYERRPSNPFSIHEFEAFCEQRGIRVENRVCLRGDWQSHCRALPNLFAGYAIYDLTTDGAVS